MNWSDRQFKGVFKHDDGQPMTLREAKEALMDELEKGHKVIPCGPVCEGFDYSGGGCPGHHDTLKPVCRVCGCTENAPCEGGCEWVEPDLCSACAFTAQEP